MEGFTTIQSVNPQYETVSIVQRFASKGNGKSWLRVQIPSERGSDAKDT